MNCSTSPGNASSTGKPRPDAPHLMEALEEQFGIDFGDYDAYRYFQPEGFDVFLKRKSKGRGDKIALTIGMLYQAVKAQRFDTWTLESV